MIRAFVRLRAILWHSGVFAGGLGLMLGTWIACLLIVRIGEPPAVIVHQIASPAADVPINGRIDLLFRLDQRQNCPSVTSQWLWTWIDLGGKRLQKFVPLGLSASMPIELGQEEEFVLSFPVPRDVWPGQWYYYSKTFEHCRYFPIIFNTTTRESGNVPIHIVEERR